jgi:hypothetical protein
MTYQEQITQLAQQVTNLLWQICELANHETENNEHVGTSEFFCDSYPFGASLDEVAAEVQNWTEEMRAK